MPILSSIIHAKNSKRKNHRVTVPITVIINNCVYNVLDWSMSGLKIDTTSNTTKCNASIDDIIKINMILPTGKSSIMLDMDITVKNIASNHYGFEISNINEKNRRVLRHYATLVIDGSIDNIDDLSSTLFMQNIASPIKEPILLSDQESVKLHKSFLKRFVLNISLGIVFLMVSVSTFLYNYIIIQKGSGLIAGNSSICYSPYDGILKNIYVKKGEHISKNQALFEMKDKDYTQQLEILTSTRSLLNKQLKIFKKNLVFYTKFGEQKKKEIHFHSKQEIQDIEKNYQIQLEMYKRAQYLYNNQLLSFAQFSIIQNQYLLYMDKYNSLHDIQNSTNKNILILEQEYTKNQDHILSTQNTILSILKEIEANKLSISEIKVFIENAIVLSSVDGIVYNINKKIGDSLEYANNVLIIETYTKPFVLIKVSAEDIENIQVGASCIVYSNRTQMNYYGHISGTGYPAVDGIYVGGNELSQSDIPVKIEFDQNIPKFGLNEYVNVYIINSSPLSDYIIKLIFGKNS